MCIRDSPNIIVEKKSDSPDEDKSLADSKAPVSYTHLDVYKRQREHNAKYCTKLSRSKSEAAFSVRIRNRLKRFFRRYVAKSENMLDIDTYNK